MATYVKAIKSGKLTKKFLMRLLEGVYLVSNVYEQKGKPAFAGNVSPLSIREKQWKKTVEAFVNQRLCDVFKSKRDYETWSKDKYNHQIR